jgi:hypothetical protein
MLPPELVASDGYADLADKLTRARLLPMLPIEPDGKHAACDDFLKEYQRLRKA